MELHTLGADAGYIQEDVASFAKALPGWSLRGPNSGKPDAGAFAFFPERHEPGTFAVFGKSYPPGGLEQGQAVLADLARHPATARHLARKLAAHFIADVPPEAAVGRGERRASSLAAVAAGRVLANPDGPRIATLALDG